MLWICFGICSPVFLTLLLLRSQVAQMHPFPELALVDTMLTRLLVLAIFCISRSETPAMASCEANVLRKVYKVTFSRPAFFSTVPKFLLMLLLSFL